jgi:HEAT repeat protein
LIKKNKLKKLILQVIDDRYTNIQEKAQYIESTFIDEEHFEEVFLGIVKTHPKTKYRKSAASILGYMNDPDLVNQLIDQIFKENQWSVRYPLAQSYSKQLGSEAVNKLLHIFNEITKEVDQKQKHQLKMLLAEALGLLGQTEAIPILQAIMGEVGNDRNKYAIELLMQCLYSLGEIGDKAIVEFLLRYSAETNYSVDSIRKSASHAIDKIAKRLRFNSKRELLEEIYKDKSEHDKQT